MASIKKQNNSDSFNSYNDNVWNPISFELFAQSYSTI